MESINGKISLWGNINAVKMTIVPKFNYMSMMLPIKFPNIIFKQYNALNKNFWGKEKGLKSG